jgi:hypothetical protein
LLNERKEIPTQEKKKRNVDLINFLGLLAEQNYQIIIKNE